MIDAAKAMRLFHESPELSAAKSSRCPSSTRASGWRTTRRSSTRVRLVAVPTTAGTGSEVSPAAVLTVDGRKATLVDYSLVPDMAVVEPRLTLSMPPTLTADTGIDALTHALEAAVSIFASPYTDAFCVQAVYQILAATFRAPSRTASDLEARTAMANAATIAGLAFSNAFVGVNHALAHAVGARFGIAHGRANAHLPAARPALQRLAADEVHARARATRPTSRPRSTPRSLGSSGSAARPRSSAASACSRRSRSCWTPSACRARSSRRVSLAPSSTAALPGAGPCRLRGPEHPHQPPHPACPRADRAARGRLRQGDVRGVGATAAEGPPARPRRHRARAPRRGGPAAAVARAGPDSKAAFASASASNAAGARAVAATSPVQAGVPVARSIRWWRSRPSGRCPTSACRCLPRGYNGLRDGRHRPPRSRRRRAPPGSGGHVELDAEEAQPLGRPGSAARCPLAHAAREHQRVGPAERDRHRRDAGGEPVQVHAERQTGVVVAGEHRPGMSAVPTSAMRPDWRSSASCTSSGRAPGRRATGRVRDRRCRFGSPS